MGKIDSFLLKKFQQFSDWFQLWTGLTNFHLAKFFMTLGFLSFAARTAQRLLWKGVGVWEIVGMILDLLFYLYIVNKIKIGERNCYQNIHFQSSLAIEFATFRRLSRFVVLFTLYDSLMTKLFGLHLSEENPHEKLSYFFMDLGVVMEFFTFYFASCTPKPLRPSRLKEFIGRMNSNLQPQMKRA